MKYRERYFIIAVLFLTSTVNYADRATLSNCKTGIKHDLGLDSVAVAYLISAWAWSYLAAQIPAGWLLDRFGSKRVYGLGIFFWSLFIFLVGFTGFLHGTAAYTALFVLLFLAGFALAPAFPGNGRFVAAWFPTKERGIASAIFNSSQYFSLVLFAPFMGWIAQNFPWRYVFWAMGFLGFVLTAIWFAMVHSPKDDPRLSPEELDYIKQGGGLVDMDLARQKGQVGLPIHWGQVRQLLRSRMLIGVYLGQFCITTLTYFFLNWFPGYLEDRGMRLDKAGLVAALPALCGCAGGVSGGKFSDWLLRRGRSLTFARKLPIVLGMLLSCVMIVCNYVQTNWIVVAIMCVSFYGKGFGALGWSVVSDTSPKEIVGLSGGLFNTIGNIPAITTSIVIGYLIKGPGGFASALIFVGANAIGAILCYLLVVGEIKRLELKPTAD